MRDLLVLGIVLAALPFILRHTWVGVLTWTWFSIMTPHRLAFGFAFDAPFAAVVAGVTLLSLVVTRDKLRMLWAPPVVALFLFVVWMCLTTALAIDPAGSWDQLNKVLKIQLMTAVALIALQERKHIELFVWVNVLSVGYFGVKGGLFTILQGGGGRVWGPPGGFIQDNNALAIAIIMILPLVNFLRVCSTRPVMRFGLLGMMLLCTASAFGSQSRGALLAISAMALVLWYRSDRKLLVGAVIATVAIALIAFMPDSWNERMGTIETYEADSSAMNRIWAWQTAINVANHRLTGAGFGMYNMVVHAIYGPPEQTSSFAAHSIYFSVLGEHGYVGLFLFLAIWGLTFRLAGQLRKATKNQPESAWLYHLAGMCQVSLVGYLAGGAFLSLAYFDLPYNVLVILAVSQRLQRVGASQPETTGSFVPASTASLSGQPDITSRPLT